MKNKKSIFFKMIDIKTLKFLIVGVVNTLVGAGVMFVAYNFLGAGYWLASALNYIVGSIVSYYLNKYFTFQYRKKSFTVVWKFIINISLCYFLAYGIAKPLARMILGSVDSNIQENIAMLAGMLFFVLFNYIGQRLWVFRIEKS